LPEHIMISGALLLFGLGYILCIAQSVPDRTLRRMTQAVAVVPAIVAYLLLRPESFAEQTLVLLSTSQWIGLLTGLPAAVFFAVLYKASLAHPESAMSLDLTEHYALVGQKPEAAPAKAEAEPSDEAKAPAKAEAEPAGDAPAPKDEAQDKPPVAP
jgi:phosphatidylglycerol---prolipoprotein diacylglyceryl transferase